MMTLHDDKLASLTDFDGMGLSQDQRDYVKVLAIEAGWGAWARESHDREASIAYLKGEVTGGTELKKLAVRLLELAATNPDHQWEAPILTGRPTQFAAETLLKLKTIDA
jgi:hypothetical protein